MTKPKNKQLQELKNDFSESPTDNFNHASKTSARNTFIPTQNG